MGEFDAGEGDRRAEEGGKGRIVAYHVAGGGGAVVVAGWGGGVWEEKPEFEAEGDVGERSGRHCVLSCEEQGGY